jgi:hypothetical protein
METIMKKYIFLVALGIAGTLTADAQTKIKDGSVTGSPVQPASGVILELESNKRGMLLPRMTQPERDAIAAPANGLVIYNTDENCLNAYNGTAWQSMCAVPPYLAKWFYMPSVVFDVSVQGTGFTKDLYQEYINQFTAPKAISTGAPALKTAPNKTDLYYYILDYDTTVFANVSVDENGVMTYDIISEATDATFINIVFLAK